MSESGPRLRTVVAWCCSTQALIAESRRGAVLCTGCTLRDGTDARSKRVRSLFLRLGESCARHRREAAGILSEERLSESRIGGAVFREVEGTRVRAALRLLCPGSKPFCGRAFSTSTRTPSGDAGILADC